MSPRDARSLLGQFEKKGISLDGTIRNVVVDTNCILYIHYVKTMASYHKWDPLKAQRAFDDHTTQTCKAIAYAIRGCRDLLDACYEYFAHRDIEITFAFDGSQPIEKIPVLRRRARRVKAARRIVRRALAIDDPTDEELKRYYSNVPATVPPSEAFYNMFVSYVRKRNWTLRIVPAEVDKHCAEACVRGEYDAMVSNDWDPLLFGCPVIVREVPRRDRLVTFVRLRDVLDGLSIDREELCAICIFSGVDYNYECCDYVSPAVNHQTILRAQESGLSLDEVRRFIAVDEKTLRWDICKDVYRIADRAQ